MTVQSEKVAPVRERGLKSVLMLLATSLKSRSREGAWIEIRDNLRRLDILIVAPVRERGLKWRRRPLVRAKSASLP